MHVAVKALQAISDKLKKNVNWKVKERSCIEDGGFSDKINIDNSDIMRDVTCDCTFNNNTVCHVTNM